jgi:hypothetical protein
MENTSGINSGYTTYDSGSESGSESDSDLQGSLYNSQDIPEITRQNTSGSSILSPRTSSKIYLDELSNYSSENDKPFIPKNVAPKIFDTKKYGYSPSIFFNPYSKIAKDYPQIIRCLVDVFKKTSKYVQVESSVEDYGNLYLEIGKFVISEIACKGLNQTYVEDSIARAHAIIIIGPAGVPLFPNNESPPLTIGDKIPIYAFSTLTLKTQDYLKADIICSNNALFSGGGSNLMDALEEMSKLIWAKYIILDSVQSAISFYEKFGFKKIRLIAGGLMEMKKDTGLCPMDNIFSPIRGGKKRKTKKLKTKKLKTKKLKTKKLKTKKLKTMKVKTKKIRN